MSYWTDKSGRLHVGVMVNGKRVHRRLPEGATARDAKQLEADIRASIKRTQAVKPASIPDDPPLIMLLAEYAEHAKRSLRSPATAIHHAQRIGQWAERYRASEARQAAAHIVKDLTGTYAPATINRSLGTLKKALALAWDRGQTPVNYSSLVKRLTENNARTTWLTMEQVQAIADHCSEDVQAAIWISLFTGCRRGEVCSIRPEDIGEDTILLHAGNTKTARSRSVPIIPSVRPWLGHLPLSVGFEGIKSAWRRGRERAGMPHVQFRDLRRSCGTLLIQNGVPLHVVSRILGHTSTKVTEQVYAHLANQQMHDGLAVLDELHRKITPGKTKAA